MTAPASDIVTLDEVAAHLGWSAAEKARQAVEMGGFISGITAVVEAITGPVQARACDEWHDGGAPSIFLLNPPVTAITLVTEGFGSGTINTLTAQPLDGVTAQGLYGYVADLSIGALFRQALGRPCNFWAGRRNVHVTYTAGHGAVPANVRLGALELIRTNWQPQQGGNRPEYDAGGNDDETYAILGGYFVTSRVMGLLAPNRDGGYGIA